MLKIGPRKQPHSERTRLVLKHAECRPMRSAPHVDSTVAESAELLATSQLDSEPSYGEPMATRSARNAEAARCVRITIICSAMRMHMHR